MFLVISILDFYPAYDPFHWISGPCFHIFTFSFIHQYVRTVPAEHNISSIKQKQIKYQWSQQARWSQWAECSKNFLVSKLVDFWLQVPFSYFGALLQNVTFFTRSKSFKPNFTPRNAHIIVTISAFLLRKNWPKELPNFDKYDSLG